MKTYWDTKTLEEFKDLLESQIFKDKVLELRQKNGIPPTGYDVRDEGSGLYQRSTKQIHQLFLDERIMIRELNISPYLEEILHEYILRDVDYESISPRRLFGKMGHGVSMTGPFIDHIDLKIYPGTSRESALTFIKNNWSGFERFFKANFPERYKKRIKKKPNRKRDADMMTLVDAGVLRKNGNYNLEKAEKFLEENGATDTTPNERNFEEIGYDLPKSDARKKVIGKMLKLRNHK